MNNIDLNYRLNQERLETFRQNAQLRSLIKAKPSSLRLRTAQILRGWAYRLSPELETEFASREASWT